MQLQHFYLRDKQNRPFGVIALLSNHYSHNTQVGVSLCHENDNFDKKLGRKIAIGRAQADRIQSSVHVEWDETLSFLEVLRELLVDYKRPENIRYRGFDKIVERLDVDQMEKTWEVALQKSKPRQEAA